MITETYKSLEEKSQHFESFTIDNPKGFDDLLAIWQEPSGIFTKGSEKNYIFRGLTEAKYKLYNSAQRFWSGQELNKLGKTYQEFIQTEIDNTKSFQAYLLYKYYDAFGHDISEISILSFLQHYGAPTPLIDFTYWFDIAAFFATDGLLHVPSNDIDNYFSIYAIDISATKGEFPSIINHIDSNLIQLKKVLDDNVNTVNNSLTELQNVKELKYKDFHDFKLFYLPGYTPDGIKFNLPNNQSFNLTYNQNTLNIINQQGLLIFNSDESNPLEYFFAGNTANQSTFILPKIKCWNIHKSLSIYIKQYLTSNRDIPIDRDFIYPQEEFIAQRAFQEFKKMK